LKRVKFKRVINEIAADQKEATRRCKIFLQKWQLFGHKFPLFGFCEYSYTT